MTEEQTTAAAGPLGCALNPPKLVLTGFMATGKSSVGLILARRLGLPFVDTDEEVLRRSGKSAAAIIIEDGEARLRELEREIIAGLASRPEREVIATGGGALVDPRNFAALSSVSTIVCLEARPEVIAVRVATGSQQRPKLAGGSLLERINELLNQRRSSYARAAFSVDTSEVSPEEAARLIVERLKRRGVLG